MPFLSSDTCCIAIQDLALGLGGLQVRKKRTKSPTPRSRTHQNPQDVNEPTAGGTKHPGAQPLEPRGLHKAHILWTAWMEALLFLHTRLQYNMWDIVSYPYIIQRLMC